MPVSAAANDNIPYATLYPEDIRKKKKAKKRGPLEESEIRTFVRVFRMYPDMNRLDNIIQAQPKVFSQRKRAEWEELGNELVAFCTENAGNQ